MDSYNPGFNGATPFQTWKSGGRYEDLATERALQWGHAFSDVEIPAATMGDPNHSRLQWGHAFSDVEMSRNF